MPRSKEAIKRAKDKYEKNNVRRFTLKLSRVDADLIEFLDSKENINGYLKTLIRNDKEKGGV
jgi:hypothetical protein